MNSAERRILGIWSLEYPQPGDVAEAEAGRALLLPPTQLLVRSNTQRIGTSSFLEMALSSLQLEHIALVSRLFGIPAVSQPPDDLVFGQLKGALLALEHPTPDILNDA